MLVVEEAELSDFFGLFYARGLLSYNLMLVQKLFSANVGHPSHSSIMTCNHFQFIKMMIGFDNATTRDDRWKTDKFTAFRGVSELFNNQCAKNYTPDYFLDIDETVYPTRKPGRTNCKIRLQFQKFS